MTRMELNMLVEQIISIRDRFPFDRSDRDALADACNVIYHNIDTLSDEGVGQMTKEKIIENLKEIVTELDMTPAEYADYVNEKYEHDGTYKVMPSEAWAYRTGAVKARIEDLIKRGEQNEIIHAVTKGRGIRKTDNGSEQQGGEGQTDRDGVFLVRKLRSGSLEEPVRMR